MIHSCLQVTAIKVQFRYFSGSHQSNHRTQTCQAQHKTFSRAFMTQSRHLIGYYTGVRGVDSERLRQISTNVTTQASWNTLG